MQKGKVSIQKGQFENVLAVAFAPVVALTELIKNSSDACTIPNDKIEIHINQQAQTIRIIDKGYGFSHDDIENLYNIGYSSKMRSGNKISRIGEPFAGSKGLGILTAFNLCKKLEIFTFSQEDQKTYHIIWEKGTAEIGWEEISQNRLGSEFILHGVSSETFQLILFPDELNKLRFSSIKSCVDNKNLPLIELFNDGKPENSIPEIKLEDLYQNNKKGTNGSFVAKASFKYSQNKLTLSYEDNIKGRFNIQDAEIDLTDLASIQLFLKKYGVSGLNLKDEVAEFDSHSIVEDFSGVYYIWRGSKDAIKGYPYGVRIYINNYGLYNYLNSEYDWLQHSEISQNIKATNYKLKNTYGFVSFANYCEEESSLKISNERNDFLETLAKKKFFFIMRKFVSAIFSRIDINTRIPDDPDKIVFRKRANAQKKVVVGSKLNINDFITTNLPYDRINTTVPSGVYYNDLGELSFDAVGTYQLCFEYDSNSIIVPVIVEDCTPYFELKKSEITIRENNSDNLEKYIKTSSLKNLRKEQIKIECDNAVISGGKLFAANNTPGTYIILYKCSDEMTQTLEVNVIPMHSPKTDRLKKLFPYICSTYPKISDVISDIAESHSKHPTLCAIAMRPLVEFSLKAFIFEFYTADEIAKIRAEKEFNVEGKLENLFNRVATDKLYNLSSAVINKYKDSLKEHRKQITKAYKDLDLNSLIHDPETFYSEKDVVSFMQKLRPFLNFIIESLNSK